ncbi:MAG: histidine kinase [Nitrospirota bacterium]|nr:histidine kinase [Nitrospirota bacterium]MDH5774350.1 histidine kinase [Nitrospirota bacterium]
MAPLKSSKPTKRSPSPITKMASRTAKGVTPSRVAIIGAGQGGTALMEIFAEDPLVTVVGVAETRPITRGVRLAKKLGIPVLRRYQDLLKMKDVDLVIDVTGNPEVEQKLLDVQAPHLALVGGASAKFMWQLIEARIRASAEIESTLTRYQSLFRLYVKEEAEGAVDEERTRIACEIHDGLVQTLVGVNLKMERVRELVLEDPNKGLTMMNQTKGELKHAIQEAREVVYNLRPGQYDHMALIPALSNYLTLYEREHRIGTTFEGTGDESQLDPKAKVFVFRMVQEALSNVVKHANATKVVVNLHLNKDLLEAKVLDDGQGFDLQKESQNPEKWDHFGVRSMKERARMLGGEVRWVSKPRAGTTVEITIPLATKEKFRYAKKN